ncbi:vacuolar iron transporter 1 isoform X1 [Brassica rapa]|uniref:vacuolar iron transporter 1 isoform X1 n=1 Tax=Brassica campestris TaxID=3711 RepID=UPI0004F1B5FB|nr:vacuolar iron transporter 1 isoform X1 [Brassica rapa]XP_048599733.1 vacuolar iron transporter 1 isoform X1 [Brassica napus]
MATDEDMITRISIEPEKQSLLDHHTEKHFTAGEVVRDIIIGVSDGLTVPFALAAGLSGANASSSIVLTAGIAEVAAGAISMGLGGIGLGYGFKCSAQIRYLAAKSEADHYAREMKREQEEIVAVPETEAAEVAEILAQYGVEPHEYSPVVNALRKNPQAWLDFMMRFELGLEKPDPKRALQSAFTIAIAYVLGGLVPLFPYMFIPQALNAVVASAAITLIALFIFGYAKGHFTGSRPFRSAFETTFIGAIASAAAFCLAKVVQH